MKICIPLVATNYGTTVILFKKKLGADKVRLGVFPENKSLYPQMVD